MLQYDTDNHNGPGDLHPIFCNTIDEEEEKNESNAHIIDLTYNYLSEDDTIVTNNNHLQQSIRHIYFPDLNLSYIDEDTKIVPKINHSCRNLLFLTYEVQVVDIEDQINAQGFEIELIEHSYFTREFFVIIYELRPITS